MPAPSAGSSRASRASTGSFAAGCRLYLITGTPGAGKTTLALHFLREGLRRGEPAIYVALSESGSELEDVARSHGWDLAREGLHVCDLGAGAPMSAYEPLGDERGR